MLRWWKMLSFWHQNKGLAMMKKWIYEKSLVICLGALALYILIWCTVSYIGVQVTYILGPVILVSGLLAYFCSPSEKSTSREWKMKTLKFLTYGSFLVILINLALAVNSSMNGTYDSSQVQRMVPFIFIFLISISAWLLIYIFKKVFSKAKPNG